MTLEEINKALSQKGDPISRLHWFVELNDDGEYVVSRYDLMRNRRHELFSVGTEAGLDIVIVVANIANQYYRGGLEEGRRGLQAELRNIVGLGEPAR